MDVAPLARLQMFLSQIEAGVKPGFRLDVVTVAAGILPAVEGGIFATRTGRG